MAKRKYKRKLEELKSIDGGEQSRYFLKRANIFSGVLALILLAVIISGGVLFLTLSELDLAIVLAVIYLPVSVGIIGISEIVFSMLFFRAFVYQLRLKKRPRAFAPLILWFITQLAILSVVLIIYI